ncbi:MAG TPA: hypothetical protein VFY87_24520 [Geminicoccaceae bacterium]|nr:hypothetical protein [Geminicoccaceae bacterium]
MIVADTSWQAEFETWLAPFLDRLAVLLARQLDLCPCCERDRRQPANIS